MARQGRTPSTSWLLPTTIAIGCVAVISFSLTNNAQSSAEEKCAAEAKKTFDELRDAYAAELNRLQLKIEVVSSVYESHLNAKIGKCLVLINKTTSLSQEQSIISYLLDSSERRIYASYVETAGKMLSCTLVRARQTKECKSREEFEAFVSDYMEKQTPGN